jgi:hypothetical protein|tara:strand:+ start:840 stop:1877 length:1038 start_codon:yes stop_codon:yes gene_type:complete
MRDRREHLQNWVRQRLAEKGMQEYDDAALLQVSGDASFRHYYRARAGSSSYIAVDAPPQQEDSRPFVSMARLLLRHGLNAPVVYDVDYDLGFMLLSDLGDDLYSAALVDEAEADRLYGQAFQSLLRIQQIDPAAATVPSYDRAALLGEMALFPEWFVTQQLGLDLTESERILLEGIFELLITNSLSQPQVLVHRDYHSRNLLITPTNSPGMVDFQDAVIGAVTYDLVSLLRDCYISWEPDKVTEWALQYAEMALEAGILKDLSEQEFIGWFDLMGVQRHLKVAGIFSRLHLRDGKPIYLKDIPLVMRYITQVCSKYAALSEFLDWIKRRILPAMQEKVELFGPLR